MKVVVSIVTVAGIADVEVFNVEEKLKNEVLRDLHSATQGMVKLHAEVLANSEDMFCNKAAKIGEIANLLQSVEFLVKEFLR